MAFEVIKLLFQHVMESFEFFGVFVNSIDLAALCLKSTNGCLHRKSFQPCLFDQLGCSGLLMHNFDLSVLVMPNITFHASNLVCDPFKLLASHLKVILLPLNEGCLGLLNTVAIFDVLIL